MVSGLQIFAGSFRPHKMMWNAAQQIRERIRCCVLLQYAVIGLAPGFDGNRSRAALYCISRRRLILPP
jgi:hypothetical protein